MQIMRKPSTGMMAGLLGVAIGVMATVSLVELIVSDDEHWGEGCRRNEHLDKLRKGQRPPEAGLCRTPPSSLYAAPCLRQGTLSPCQMCAVNCMAMSDQRVTEWHKSFS
jgi:hypothetical protein